MTLSDTHLVLLSAAARRDDHLLPRPDRLFGSALDKLAARLVRAGVAETLVVTPDQPHWSANEAGAAVGLRITAAGLAAIGITGELADAPAQPTPASASARPSPQSRPGTRRTLLLDLLRRQDGASAEELQAATGWLPHTVRAALTGLRKSGHTLDKSRTQAGVTRYRLTAPASGAGTPDSAE